jgi:uncharacterized protein
MVDARSVVTSFLDNLHKGDIDACCALFAPAAAIREADSLPFGGLREGPDGFRSLVGEVGRLYKLRLGEPTVNADGAVATVRFDITMTSRGTGRGVEMRVIDVYTIEGGLITELDVYYQDTKAIAELELSEESKEGDSADAA